MSPSCCEGRARSRARGDQGAESLSAAMTSTAPRVGSSAAVPGKGVEESNRIAAQATIASPTQASVERSNGERRRQRWCTARARIEPSPSSHTRVGVTK